MSHRPFTRAVPLVLAAVLSLGACGVDDTDPGSNAEGTTLSLRVTEDGITPNGELVEMAKGQTVNVEIDSDHAGSFHIHSEPEQEIEFGVGKKSYPVSFDSSGKFEMESHDPSLIVAIFVVR